MTRHHDLCACALVSTTAGRQAHAAGATGTRGGRRADGPHTGSTHSMGSLILPRPLPGGKGLFCFCPFFAQVFARETDANNQHPWGPSWGLVNRNSSQASSLLVKPWVAAVVFRSPRRAPTSNVQPCTVAGHIHPCNVLSCCSQEAMAGTTPEEEAYERKQQYKSYLHKHGASSPGKRAQFCVSGEEKVGGRVVLLAT